MHKCKQPLHEGRIAKWMITGMYTVVNIPRLIAWTIWRAGLVNEPPTFDALYVNTIECNFFWPKSGEKTINFWWSWGARFSDSTATKNDMNLSRRQSTITFVNKSGTIPQQTQNYDLSNLKTNPRNKPTNKTNTEPNNQTVNLKPTPCIIVLH